jgi:hypothetical protein
MARVRSGVLRREQNRNIITDGPARVKNLILIWRRDVITVFQFQLYDVSTDTKRKSRRWGTREGVAALGGEILEHTATDIADADLRSDIPGLTAVGFNPHWQKRPPATGIALTYLDDHSFERSASNRIARIT